MLFKQIRSNLHKCESNYTSEDVIYDEDQQIFNQYISYYKYPTPTHTHPLSIDQLQELDDSRKNSISLSISLMWPYAETEGEESVYVLRKRV